MSDEPQESKQPRVRLTCTTTGTLRLETAAALLAVTRDERYAVDLHLMNDRPYESALNVAARNAMADDYDWWLHVDADQFWHGKPLDAIAHDVDFVSFPAPIYHPGGGPGSGSPVMCFGAWHVSDPHDWTQVIPAQPNGKLQRVDVISSGSFLMRVTALRESAIPAPFARRYDVNGVADRGCDMEFSRKWHEAGLLTHADFGCICGHFNTVNLLEVMADMGALQREALQAVKSEGNGQAARIVRPSIRGA